MGLILNPYRFATGGASLPATADMWLEAQLLTGLTNGDTVNTWTDASGNGNHQARDSGSPKYVTNVINGKPVISFRDGGTQDVFANPGANFAQSWTEGELIGLIKLDADPPSSGNGGAFLDCGAATDAAHLIFTNGINYEPFGVTSRQTTGDPTASFTNWTLYNVRVSSAGVMTVYINNSLHYTSGTLTVDFGSAQPSIGKSVGSSNWFDGDMALIVMNSAVYSTADRNAIIDYINTEYGTSF